ncbi:MAG: hypothetical protein L6V79_05890 [Clostridium sp.]|nr:MAG: hypothetical protein L6V79_05890 [Clostridium sp.]
MSGVSDAIDEINRRGTRHSECIVTEDKAEAEKFTTLVDAAATYVNTSTRFTDGFEFGFGAEMGISTGKNARERSHRAGTTDVRKIHCRKRRRAQKNSF